MAWMADNLWQVLVFTGLGLLALEVFVLGLSTFVLFFVGLAALITGVFMMIGLMPQSMGLGVGSVAILSGGLALVLWKPMKRLQEKVDHKPVTNDFIGTTFTLSSDIAPDQPGSHQFSGIQWTVVSSTPLAAGTHVKVVGTEVGRLTVEAA